MYIVYILRSLKRPERIYIGFTTVEIKLRVKRHNDGSTPATARYRPWELVTYTAFANKDKALAYERYLKSGSGRAFLHKRLI